MMDAQLAHPLGHELPQRAAPAPCVKPGANAIRLPPSMRAVTSLERRKHPDTQCATRRMVESPAARPKVVL
jgi:hypothetical protein